MQNRRGREAAERFEERRRREDEAPRLVAEVPTLQSLRLEIREVRPGQSTAMQSHVRHVVVPRAPALFVFSCAQSDCDGGHDITSDILRPLRGLETEFSGQHECDGLRMAATCGTVLHFKGTAVYSA